MLSKTNRNVHTDTAEEGFGANTINAWIHPALPSAGETWLRAVFSWHLVPSEDYLNTTAYPRIVADRVHPFTTAVLTHLVTKLRSSHTAFLNVTMSSLYSELLSILHSHLIQQSPLGMRMCSRQICSICVMLRCQYEAKSVSNVSTLLKPQN